jgi:hypothetical protein
MSTAADSADTNDAPLIDLSITTLDGLLLGGDTPLDLAAEAAAAALTEEVFASFGNAPRVR